MLSDIFILKFWSMVSFWALLNITFFSILSCNYIFCVIFKHLVRSWILNSVPFFYSLWQLILPPIYSTIDLQIDKPRPVPPVFCSLFSSNLLKLMNSLLIPSSEIPLPLSTILISKEINLCFDWLLLDDLPDDLSWSVILIYRVI